MLGNWTGSTANFAANAMPSCPDSGGNHLNYVSGTGITCGTGDAGSVALTNTHIFVGNVSNVATDVALSGDATMANTGAISVTKTGIPSPD